jgi:putative membrane protein
VNTAANVVVGIVAFLHIYFFVLESFLFDKPIGLKTFQLSKEFVSQTQVASLFRNQGLYNSFLAAGLIASFIVGEPIAHFAKVFFLACVAVAGLVGGLTVGPKIFAVQMVPALIGLGLVFAAH